MKKKSLRLLVAVFAAFLFTAFVVIPPSAEPVPGDVKEILKSSCFDCHSDGASSEKAIKALDFDQWDHYKVTKKIAKLEAICEVVKEDKMPPAKYLKSKPERKLTDKQKEEICLWTKKESEHLLEGGE